MKVALVIPCYNTEKMIRDIVARASQYVDEIIVADDNSTDKTVLVAQEAGAVVVQSKTRRGFGGNVRSGINYALSNEADIIVTMDGDGQHDPDEIPQIVELAIKGKADLVIGSRFIRDYHIPSYRKFGIDIITWLYNVGARQKIFDAQCCFRVYNKKLLKSFATIEKGFGFSTEVLIKARAMGFRIREVPVSCIYHRELKDNSSMNPILHGICVVLSTVKWRVWLDLFVVQGKMKGKGRK